MSTLCSDLATIAKHLSPQTTATYVSTHLYMIAWLEKKNVNIIITHALILGQLYMLYSMDKIVEICAVIAQLILLLMANWMHTSFHVSRILTLLACIAPITAMTVHSRVLQSDVNSYIIKMLPIILATPFAFVRALDNAKSIFNNINFTYNSIGWIMMPGTIVLMFVLPMNVLQTLIVIALTSSTLIEYRLGLLIATGIAAPYTIEEVKNMDCSWVVITNCMLQFAIYSQLFTMTLLDEIFTKIELPTMNDDSDSDSDDLMIDMTNTIESSSMA